MDSFSIASLIISAVCLVCLVPLYGKVFFSTHTREFLPLDEYAKIQKDLRQAYGVSPNTNFADGDLGLDIEQLTPEEQEQVLLEQLQKQMWTGTLNDSDLDGPLSDVIRQKMLAKKAADKERAQ